MVSKAPAFQFYVKDWLGSFDVSRMTPEQRGYYIQMVVRAWDEDYGRLQNDPNLIWQYAGAKSREEFERPLEGFSATRVCDLVLSQFTVRGKKLCNERLLVERHKQLSHSDTQRDKARARWDKAKKVKKIDAVAMPDENARHESGNALPLHLPLQSASTTTKPSTKPSVAVASGRHVRIREMIQEAYKEHNHETPTCPWDGAEGKQLDSLLKKTPDWPETLFAQCLANLYASDGFPRGTPPREFIGQLPKYIGGPLNEFKNAKGAVNETGAKGRVARNLATIARAADRISGRAGDDAGSALGQLSAPGTRGRDGCDMAAGMAETGRAVRDGEVPSSTGGSSDPVRAHPQPSTDTRVYAGKPAIIGSA
jgi:hypothetical protein